MNVETLQSRPDWAVVSASRSNLPADVNAARHAALCATLDERGFAYLQVDGIWQGDREQSVLILGIHESTALRIATEWNQDAVLTGSALCYASGDRVPVLDIAPGLDTMGGSTVHDGDNVFSFHVVM